MTNRRRTERAGYPATILAFLAAGLAIGSPAGAEEVTLLGHFPAQNAEASQLRRLSVYRFDGNAGGVTTGAVESTLASGDGGEVPWFTIVTDPGSGRRGKRVGSAGVVAGSAEAAANDSQVQRQTYECIEKMGKRCVRYRTVSCLVRAVTLTVNARITRVADNRVVYSAMKPMREEYGWCEGEMPGKSADQAVAELAQAAAAEIRREISPYTQSYKIRVREGTEGLEKQAKDRFKTAVKLSVKNLQTSCTAWEALRAEAPNSPSVMFDLGICAEARGDFTTASSYYDRAQALAPGGSKKAAEGATRIRLLAAAKEQMQQQQARRQDSEAAELRAQAEAERAAQRQAAQQLRAQRAAEAQGKRRAATEAAAARSARQAERQQVAAKYGESAANSILAHKVTRGMTAAQVQAALGSPSRRERISAGEEQWFYPGQRVVFSGGRVTFVGS